MHFSVSESHQTFVHGLMGNRELHCAALRRPGDRTTVTDRDGRADESYVSSENHVVQRLLGCALALAIWLNDPLQACPLHIKIVCFGEAEGREIETERVGRV
jgi:hypothetical protein